MRQKIMKLSAGLGVVLILLRITYVNFFYPQTKLEYVNTDSFIYQGIKIEIKDVSIQKSEEEILAQINCLFINETSDDRIISKSDIGLINGGYYLYCDYFDGSKIEVKAKETVENTILFKFDESKWQILEEADFILMDFERTCIKSKIFKGVSE